LIKPAQENIYEALSMANANCELPNYNPPSAEIVDILHNFKKIAIVGISPKESRDSNKVARYLMEQGYEIAPVNPGQSEILGKTCFKTLKNIPFRIDVADLFLNPTRVPAVVDQAIHIGVRAIWMQEGVVHNDSASKARKAGIQVIMNMCIMKAIKAMKAGELTG
jgi:predicted CoA-binding protein